MLANYQLTGEHAMPVGRQAEEAGAELKSESLSSAGLEKLKAAIMASPLVADELKELI
jgi:hypothetical protein